MTTEELGRLQIPKDIFSYRWVLAPEDEERYYLGATVRYCLPEGRVSCNFPVEHKCFIGKIEDEETFRTVIETVDKFVSATAGDIKKALEEALTTRWQKDFKTKNRRG